MKSLKLTNEGLLQLQNELEHKKEKLRNLGRYKAYAAANEGDGWHDNFAFEQAEIQERALIKQINDLQEQIHTAEIIEEDNEQIDDKVTIGSKVTVILKNSINMLEKERTFVLTGNFEIKDRNNVSINSPIGECIIGKPIGFEGEYSVKDYTMYVKIINIIN